MKCKKMVDKELSEVLKKTQEMLDTPHHYGCNFTESLAVEKALKNSNPQAEKEARMPEKKFDWATAKLGDVIKSTMPDREKIGEAIEWLETDGRNHISAKDFVERWDATHKTALAILKHVQLHGLALDEEELTDMLLRYFRPLIENGNLTETLPRCIAKAIAERQRA